MTITINNIMPSPAQVAQPEPGSLLPPRSQTQLKSPTQTQTTRLPDPSECAIHLQLLNAIVQLKMAVDDWGRKTCKSESQAWDQFCKNSAFKFLEWCENVDTSEQTIPVPPLDVLMVWHSFMLNPKDYMLYMKRVLRGEFGGRGIDWQQLVSQNLSWTAF